jgi:hypothetical protein
VKKRQFNEIDFLSFVGGLLGLFAGFSVMSLIELIYWLGSSCLSMIFKKRTAVVVPVDAGHNRNMGRIEKFVKDYFNETSVHGLDYFANSTLIGK